MKRAAARLLALLALATAGSAAAQITPEAALGWLQGERIITGGIRITLEPRAVLEVSLEQPIYLSAAGWRVGGVVSVRAAAAGNDLSAHALAGVTATFPAGTGTAVQVQLLWREVYQLGDERSGGPELLVAFATGF